MPQMTLFPLNDQHIWFYISMGRKGDLQTLITNTSKLHSHKIHENLIVARLWKKVSRQFYRLQ